MELRTAASILVRACKFHSKPHIQGGHMSSATGAARIAQQPVPPLVAQTAVPTEARSSGVSWGAVSAGAFATAALSLSLLVLGTGVGLSAVSPWSNSGATASAIGWGAIIWLIVVQMLSSALGGYLAGRLRTKWVSLHTDEVYFRDTAHGFLVWSVSLVATAALLASAVAATAGGAATAASSSGSAGNAAATRVLDPNEYYVDSLLRTEHANAERNDAALRAEVSIILANAIRNGYLAPADNAYLTRIVAARTGLNEIEAQKSVSAVFEEDRQVTDAARKAAAHSMYWLFLSLLIGAFCASITATMGGKQRDRVPVQAAYAA
jgi:hypothetical protein